MRRYAKAVVAGLIAALSWAIPVVDDGLVASEVLGILLAGLTGTGLVYATPNRPRPADDRGAVTLAEVCLVLIATLLVLAAVGVVRLR